jgi:hypothetical protein
MNADDWTAVATIALFSATLLGAIFVWLELNTGRKESAEAHSRTRRQATIDFYIQTLERRIRWRSDFPDDYDRDALHSTFEHLAADPYSTDNEESIKQIKEYMAFWELTAIAITNDVYDEDLFRVMLRSRFLNIAENYRPFMDYARKERGDNTKRLYVNLQELAADWRGPVPIGGAHGPRWRFFLSWLFPRLPWLFPLLPQRAWLKDGELIVKHKERFHRCDLRKATETEIRIVNAGWRSWASEILEVRKANDEPVRLVLRDPFRILLNVEHLRMLASRKHAVMNRHATVTTGVTGGAKVLTC